MHISALEEYGLRCALQLAALPQGEYAAASQIAEKEGLSVQYAGKIMHLFRKAKRVDSVRGIQGGFRLARAAGDIRLKEVFQALREEKNESFCAQFRGQEDECVHVRDCSVRPVWQVLGGYFDSVLEKVSLGDLRRSEEESRKRIEIFAREEANRIRRKLSGRPVLEV